MFDVIYHNSHIVINILGLKIKKRVFQKIKKLNLFSKIMFGNKILGSKPRLINSEIIFEGRNNILYCEDNLKIIDSKICFRGNNSVIYLSKSGRYIIDIITGTNSVMYFGLKNSFNKLSPLRIICSEGKNIFIGNDNMFSFDVYIRNTDTHRFFDKSTLKRINFAQSIYIGNHIWFGQESMILKGTQIDSNCLLGARSLISNKITSKNEIWAGNPAKKIKDNIIWDRESVHSYTKDDIEGEKALYETDFSLPDDSINEFKKLDSALEKEENPECKLLLLKEFLNTCRSGE